LRVMVVTIFYGALRMLSVQRKETNQWYKLVLRRLTLVVPPVEHTRFSTVYRSNDLSVLRELCQTRHRYVLVEVPLPCLLERVRAFRAW
jgi:hypothetical protein